MITKCSKLIYETLQGKEVVYILPITFIFWRLPVAWGGNTGTVSLSYSDGCWNGTHHYKNYMVKADTSAGADSLLRTIVQSSWSIPGHCSQWAGTTICEIDVIKKYCYISTHSTH